jgi:hypothetical protein
MDREIVRMARHVQQAKVTTIINAGTPSKNVLLKKSLSSCLTARPKPSKTFLRATRDVTRQTIDVTVQAVSPTIVTPSPRNNEHFLSYNNCFTKSPRQRHGFIDKEPVQISHISSYRGDLTRFATAVSNADFVQKHGIFDYIKLV